MTAMDYRITIGSPEHRRVFGFREKFGFGRTDSVVRPGRRFVAGGQVVTVVGPHPQTPTITVYMTATGQVGHCFTSIVRGRREVS